MRNQAMTDKAIILLYMPRGKVKQGKVMAPLYILLSMLIITDFNAES